MKNIEEKTKKIFNRTNMHNRNEKNQDKIHNQSTELLQTEDIFINQKEEIKKIKKRRYELKQNNQNRTKGIYIKSINIKKEKKFKTINTLNLTETKKPEKEDIKSNSSKKNNLNKINNINKRNTVINKIKFNLDKLDKDNKQANDKKEEKNKINDDTKIENNSNNINEEDDNIINNENDNFDESFLNLESEIDYISLNNTEHFRKCDCIMKEQSYFNNFFDNSNDDDEIPIINEKWTILNTNLVKRPKVYIPNIINPIFDFSKKVLITKNVIDYNTKGVKINLNLKLYDEGIFYIFTRCYVNKHRNEIRRFKTISANSRKLNLDLNEKENKKNKMFSKYSTMIKIIKNKNSNKAFVSFGTFYKSKKSGHLHYKTFLQRQLVDFVHEDNNYYYLENDMCEFNIIIVDLGNEYLQAKISLNNKEKYNNIKSNFYLPLNKKAKIMFCGEGNNIKVTQLEIKTFIKLDEDRDKIDLILSDERNACDCCSIF